MPMHGIVYHTTRGFWRRKPYISEEPESVLFHGIVEAEKEFDFLRSSFICRFFLTILRALAELIGRQEIQSLHIIKTKNLLLVISFQLSPYD